MTTDDLEKRVVDLEKAAHHLHNTNLKLINRELVLRGMMYTLLEHLPDDQRKAMAHTYDKYLTSILELVPPRMQDREILQEIEEMLLQERPPGS